MANKQRKKYNKFSLMLTSLLILASCTQPTSSIDLNLQTKVDSILQLKMSEINAISGQAIVMDMGGNIKAMVGNGKKQSSEVHPKSWTVYYDANLVNLYCIGLNPSNLILILSSL